MLLPQGWSLNDCPYNVHEAISKALVYIGFQEELPEHERPPKRIWQDAEKLKEHFDAVKKKRKEEMDPKGRQIDDPVENDAAKDLIAE